MAIQKATTTSDVKSTPDLTATGESASPTLADIVKGIEENTDPAVVAKVKAPGYVTVTSPSGVKSEVPESIAGALVESGYSKSK